MVLGHLKVLDPQLCQECQVNHHVPSNQIFLVSLLGLKQNTIISIIISSDYCLDSCNHIPEGKSDVSSHAKSPLFTSCGYKQPPPKETPPDLVVKGLRGVAEYHIWLKMQNYIYIYYICMHFDGVLSLIKKLSKYS